MLFNNNNIQPSNIKIEAWYLAHGTNRLLLHIIIIFLFYTASANLIAYFLLKPMGVCFLHCWPASPNFKSFVL